MNSDKTLDSTLNNKKFIDSNNKVYNKCRYK